MPDVALAEATIFVSIAAYRDAELGPTIGDCLAKARDPDRLRFGVCWQHSTDEAAPAQFADPRVRVLDVDWRASRGACWARAEVMSLYRGEDWFLQLDSHHRFAESWDVTLIEQAGLTGSAKPILGTYAASFTPGREAEAAAQPTRIDFSRFTREGIPLQAPGLLKETPERPLRARFVSGHFLFAPGSFVEEVPYDPELYFIGEEITLAVRAFTCGYDLFHPARHVLWHEYTRTYRPRHWDDHDGASGPAWHERDASSLNKVERFLVAPHTGRWGIGTKRTLADYEAYAGISFARRRIQDYTRWNREAPNPPARSDWAEQIADYRVPIEIPRDRLPAAATADADFWYVGLHDVSGREIFRRDAEPSELATALRAGDDAVCIVREVAAEAVPVTWTVWPHSAQQGWLEKITHPIGEPRIFVAIAAYRDPDLAPTLEDCLARARHPDRLRFGICWQHGDEEVLPPIATDPRFRIVDVAWAESQGQAWARAQAMGQFDGEEWFLQIDSHHRFAQDWDVKLLDQAARTGSAKPLLTAAAAIDPFEAPGTETLWRLDFERFHPDGIPNMTFGRLPKAALDGPPIPARSVCAHCIFAPGRYVEEMPYDPELYYSCIEITLALRAYTHGYDLFHPSVHILWHDIGPVQRRKHWDDHTRANGATRPWHERMKTSVERVRAFLADPPVGGRFGLGPVRTLAEYEAYAGINFAHRCVQDHTRLRRDPPNPPAAANWYELVRDRRLEIELDLAELPSEAVSDPAFWYVGCHTSDGNELYRLDAGPEELERTLAGDPRTVTLIREFVSEAPPAAWTVIPYSHSAGWLPAITGEIRGEEQSREVATTAPAVSAVA